MGFSLAAMAVAALLNGAGARGGVNAAMCYAGRALAFSLMSTMFSQMLMS